jgi:hypothetical protein
MKQFKKCLGLAFSALLLILFSPVIFLGFMFHLTCDAFEASEDIYEAFRKVVHHLLNS